MNGGTKGYIPEKLMESLSEEDIPFWVCVLTMVVKATNTYKELHFILKMWRDPPDLSKLHCWMRPNITSITILLTYTVLLHYLHSQILNIFRLCYILTHHNIPTLLNLPGFYSLSIPKNTYHYVNMRRSFNCQYSLNTHPVGIHLSTQDTVAKQHR